jgi:ankyrin repeat protein
MGQSASALQLLRSGLPEQELLARLKSNIVDLGAKDEEDRGALHWAAASGPLPFSSFLPV